MVDDEVQARKASALAVLSAFAVACTGALTHLLGARFSWQALAVVRTCSVFLGALALSRSRSHLRLLWRASGSLWLRSLAGAGGMLCSFYVWSHLPIADAVTLLNTTPLWVAAVSGLLLKEHTGPGVWLAVVLGMLGVVLVQRPHLEQGNFAVAVALLGGFSGAMAMVGLRRVRHLDPRSVVLHMSVVSAVAAAVAQSSSGGPWPRALLGDWKTAASVTGLGLSATVAQFALTRAYALGRAARNSVLGLLQIVFAALFDVAFWGRSFGAVTLTGMLLIVAPSAWLAFGLSGSRAQGGTSPRPQKLPDPVRET